MQELVTKQLNAQRQLNQQLHAMSNILMRKKAGISLDPQLSTSISSHLMQVIHKDHIIKYIMKLYVSNCIAIL